MPTASERKALVFLLAVAAMGVAARTGSERRFERDAAAATAPELRGSDRALARQLAAVESASAAKAGKARTGTRAGTRTDTRATASRSSRSSPILEVGPALPLFPIDVDRATPEELQRLPRVGPAMARRIVANRDSFGAFGSLDALQYHVRGIGPATARGLAPLVTFSGRPRPIPSGDKKERRRSTASPDIRNGIQDSWLLPLLSR